MKATGVVLLSIFTIVTIVAARHLCGLTLNLEVNVVDLAKLFVYLFIAVFLQYYLATQIADRRVEKNLLIDGVRDAVSVLRNCRDTFLICYDSGKMTKQNKNSILGILRTLANGFDSLETAISLSQHGTLQKEVRVAKERYLDYKMVLTGGDFPVKAYGSTVAAEHERAYRTLHGGLQSLLFKINKAR